MYCSQSMRPVYLPHEATREDTIFVRGGIFRMGSDHHYREEVPAPPRHGRRLLDRPHARDEQSVPGLREGDGPCHNRLNRTGLKGLSRRFA